MHVIKKGAAGIASTTPLSLPHIGVRFHGFVTSLSPPFSLDSKLFIRSNSSINSPVERLLPAMFSKTARSALRSDSLNDSLFDIVHSFQGLNDGKPFGSTEFR